MGKQVGNSFLPQEYLQRKTESRALIINLALFTGMLTLVSGAFVLKNREYNVVKAQEAQVDADTAAEKVKLSQLRELEKKAAEFRQRAEMTRSLIEPVPRSILLAELVNRMPAGMTLTELQMQSRRVVDNVKPADGKGGQQSLASKAAGDAKPAVTPRPPRMEFTLKIVGMSQNDTEVADYQAALEGCPLLQRVDLVSTVESIGTGKTPARKFTLEAEIRPDADVRKIQPVKSDRSAGREGDRAGAGGAAGGKKNGLMSVWKNALKRDGSQAPEQQVSGVEDRPEGGEGK